MSCGKNSRWGLTMSKQASNLKSISAYTAPFLLYVLPTMVESKNWLNLSYEFVCTLKGVLAVVALWVFRKYYPKFSFAGLKLSLVAGVVGFIVWIALDAMQRAIPAVQYVTRLLLLGDRAEYNPFPDGELSGPAIAFVIVRLIELVVIVPLAEEIFWRGFLARYLISEDFQNVSHGTFTVFSFSVVTAAFASVHPEFLSAIGWGMMINVLYATTRNLWACVFMHSVTNGVLFGYIVWTGNWNLW